MSDLEISERAAEIVDGLWRRCGELGEIREKLKKPDLPPDQKGQLNFKALVLKKKIRQTCDRLQIA